MAHFLTERRIICRHVAIAWCCLWLAAACSKTTSHDTATPVKGTLTTIQGVKVLVLRGTHTERGYAHGYLCGRQIKDIFDSLFVPTYFQASESLYNASRQFIENNFVYESNYRDEAAAMAAGMEAAGVDLYNSVLQRNIDGYDLLILSTMEEAIDIAQVTDFGGCSSLSSWGSATSSDPALQGAVVITRFWDYPPYPPFTQLTVNLMLIVHCPGEPDEQNWVCGGWAGVMGACTGMNQSGVGAFLDYGNIKTKTNAGPYHGVALSLRNAIEQRDYNHDAVCSAQDVVAAVSASTPYFASIIHVVSSRTSDVPAQVIESNNARGMVLRRQTDNTEPIGQNLIATNHFRLLYPPEACWRYAKLDSLLSLDSIMTGQRSWDILTAAAGNNWSIYKIQFIPASGAVRWAQATPALAAAWQPDVSFSLPELWTY
jgi:hypothetical protein